MPSPDLTISLAKGKATGWESMKKRHALPVCLFEYDVLGLLS